MGPFRPPFCVATLSVALGLPAVVHAAPMFCRAAGLGDVYISRPIEIPSDAAPALEREFTAASGRPSSFIACFTAESDASWEDTLRVNRQGHNVIVVDIDRNRILPTTMALSGAAEKPLQTGASTSHQSVSPTATPVLAPAKPYRSPSSSSSATADIYGQCKRDHAYAVTSQFCVDGWNGGAWKGRNPNSPGLTSGRGKSIK